MSLGMTRACFRHLLDWACRYEEILHLLPNLQSLVIVLYGPDLGLERVHLPSEEILCDTCCAKNRRLTIVCCGTPSLLPWYCCYRAQRAHQLCSDTQRCDVSVPATTASQGSCYEWRTTVRCPPLLAGRADCTICCCLPHWCRRPLPQCT